MKRNFISWLLNPLIFLIIFGNSWGAYSKEIHQVFANTNSKAKEFTGVKYPIYQYEKVVLNFGYEPLEFEDEDEDEDETDFGNTNFLETFKNHFAYPKGTTPLISRYLPSQELFILHCSLKIPFNY